MWYKSFYSLTLTKNINRYLGFNSNISFVPIECILIIFFYSDSMELDDNGETTALYYNKAYEFIEYTLIDKYK